MLYNLHSAKCRGMHGRIWMISPKALWTHLQTARWHHGLAKVRAAMQLHQLPMPMFLWIRMPAQGSRHLSDHQKSFDSIRCAIHQTVGCAAACQIPRDKQDQPPRNVVLPRGLGQSASLAGSPRPVATPKGKFPL